MIQAVIHTQMTVFWVVALCSLVEIDRRFSVVHAASGKFVKLYQTTRRKHPEDSHL
jgi:hypothetical protein